MRVLVASLVLIYLPLAFWGGIASSQSEDTPVVQSVELPALVGEDAGRITLHSHGDGALMNVSGSRFDSLWRIEGDEVTPVKFANGDRILGESIFVQLPGQPAIVEFTPGGQLEMRYLRVSDGVGAPLRDDKGELFNPASVYAFRNAGVTLFFVPDSDRFYRLIDGKVRALVDANAEPFTARMIILNTLPDGRIRAVAWRGDQTYDEFFLTENKLTPVDTLDIPGNENWTPGEHYFLDDSRVMLAHDDKIARAVYKSGGETRWLEDAEGEALQSETLVGRMWDGQLYLFARQHGGSAVYHVRDGVAHAPAGEGIALGGLKMHPVAGALIVVNERADKQRELLKISPEGIERLRAEGKEFVSPAGDVPSATADGRVFLRYRDGDSTRWGELDGAQLTPIAPERRWHAPEFGAWVWEANGRVFARWEEVADGQQYEWFGELTDDLEFSPLKVGDGVLKGAKIGVVESGEDLLVTLRPLKGDSVLYRVGD